MTTATLVPVAEYLASSYEPDCDYIDGEVLERNMGEHDHGLAQINIAAWLKANARRYQIRPLVEVRLHIADRRYRIPDILVLSADAPRDPVIRHTPLLCIEVLSPSDSLSSIWKRIEDYFLIGVPVCWIVDPASHDAFIATPAGLNKVRDGVLRAGEIEVPLTEVFE